MCPNPGHPRSWWHFIGKAISKCNASKSNMEHYSLFHLSEDFPENLGRVFDLHRGFWQGLMQECCAEMTENADSPSCDQLKLWEMHARSGRTCPTHHVMHFWQGSTLHGSDGSSTGKSHPQKSNLCSAELLTRIWGLIFIVIIALLIYHIKQTLWSSDKRSERKQNGSCSVSHFLFYGNQLVVIITYYLPFKLDMLQKKKKKRPYMARKKTKNGLWGLRKLSVV